MRNNKILHELWECGQSIWVDNINRAMIESGALEKYLQEGVVGLTTNPSIFEKSITQSSDYDKGIEELASNGKTTFEIYDELTVKDVQDAADIFKPVYEKTLGLDGYVSLEVNPELAFDHKGTTAEAKRLYKKVNRPNVMFKIPATAEGIMASEDLIAEGININVTLIFSLAQYEATALAYIRGVEKLSKNKGSLKKIASVASVFVSRIDSDIDSRLDGLAKNALDRKDKILILKGEAAVSNTHMIYEKYKSIFGGSRFQVQAKNGARPQRALWASTSTKNPEYKDVKYVEDLIARDTVNTVPENTIKAFIDHGNIKPGLPQDAAMSKAVIASLKDCGIDIDKVCEKLLEDGLKSFQKSFASLLASIESKSKQLVAK